MSGGHTVRLRPAFTFLRGGFTNKQENVGDGTANDWPGRSSPRLARTAQGCMGHRHGWRDDGWGSRVDDTKTGTHPFAL